MAKLILPGRVDDDGRAVHPVARVRVVLPSPEAGMRPEELRLTLRSDGAVLRAVLLGDEPLFPGGSYSNRRRWSALSIWSQAPRMARSPEAPAELEAAARRLFPQAVDVIRETPYGAAR